jgi:tol-pal system protein YbgF
VKSHSLYTRVAFWGKLVCLVSLLSACASPQQEQSLTQIQSQLSVLSNEMRESFQKSEEETISLYSELNEDVRLLQKNQANSAAANEQQSASLIALEAKLDEYNTRMMKLNQRLDDTENVLTERITSLSEQMNDIRSETTVTPGMPPVSPEPSPVAGENLSEGGEALALGDDIDSEASRMYHQAYTLYVNGEFDSAIAGFQSYLERFPNSELADISQFWIAESLFSLGEYESALQEYDRLINQYPSSDKVSDAFYSKADAYLQLDRQIEAISHLRYVVSQFPNTAAAQRANERLQSLNPQ